MFEIFLDKIDFKRSKRRRILSFKKHIWSDEISTPVFLFIPLLTTIYSLLFPSHNVEHINDMTIYNVVVGLITLLGIFILFKNIGSLKLYTIFTGESNQENREKIRAISKELGIEKMYDNKRMYMGIFENTFKFNQVVTIIYDNQVILINSRNVSAGYNGKLGMITISSKPSKKLCQSFIERFKKYEDREQNI